MDKNQEGFSQVALSLINHYDCVFYVNIDTGHYSTLVPMKLYKSAGIPFTGNDFFSDLREGMKKIVHPSDLDNVEISLDKKRMLKRLSNNDSFSAVFRYIVDGKIVHMRHSEFMCPDREHVICCLENVEKDFQKQELQKKTLESAERMARFDELTGVRNNNAFREFTENLDSSMKKKSKENQFGVILCDLNDLKTINDTRGHSFGDEAIQRTSRMICDIFEHSPVFRIGGDEFVVVLQGHDFANRESLLSALKEESYNNKIHRSGPVVACGMSVFNPETDSDFSCVLKRADKNMYKNKKEVKAMVQRQIYKEMKKITSPITKERKCQLDSLFGALYTVSGGGYVYLTDMKYDYARWSIPLVTDFGIRSEYMYHADKFWEERIHPDDIKAYREVVDEILCDNAEMLTPLTYRARKVDGTYVVLTTRGFILSDGNGKSDYFGGIIIPV